MINDNKGINSKIFEGYSWMPLQQNGRFWGSSEFLVLQYSVHIQLLLLFLNNDQKQLKPLNYCSKLQNTIQLQTRSVFNRASARQNSLYTQHKIWRALANAEHASSVYGLMNMYWNAIVVQCTTKNWPLNENV